MKQHFLHEIEQLRAQLKNTNEEFKEEKSEEKISLNFEESCSSLEKLLNGAQLHIFEEVKSAVKDYVESQRKQFEANVVQLKV